MSSDTRKIAAERKLDENQVYAAARLLNDVSDFLKKGGWRVDDSGISAIDFQHWVHERHTLPMTTLDAVKDEVEKKIREHDLFLDSID